VTFNLRKIGSLSSHRLRLPSVHFCLFLIIIAWSYGNSFIQMNTDVCARGNCPLRVVINNFTIEPEFVRALRAASSLVHSYGKSRRGDKQ
jgi:hypothetical protein